MIASYLLTVIFLRVWFVGLAILVLASLSSFVFRSPHSLATLAKRLGLGLLWPLALASGGGRQALLDVFGLARKPAVVASFGKVMRDLKER